MASVSEIDRNDKPTRMNTKWQQLNWSLLLAVNISTRLRKDRPLLRMTYVKLCKLTLSPLVCRTSYEPMSICEFPRRRSSTRVRKLSLHKTHGRYSLQSESLLNAFCKLLVSDVFACLHGPTTRWPVHANHSQLWKTSLRLQSQT